jgi:hypothetical protein
MICSTLYARRGKTYHIVLDAVHLRVRHVRLGTGLVKAMLDPVRLQHAELLEGPAGDAPCKLAVVRADLLLLAVVNGRDLGVEPLIG